MSGLLILLFLVPIVDQALKLLIHQTIGSRAVSLGPLGSLRIIRAKIWWNRSQRSPRLSVMWAIWLLSNAALLGVLPLMPSCDWCAGLLLGGSLSHLLETSRQDCVTDYICLRFWPAFNFADAAITVGAMGLGIGMIAKIKELIA
jgi:lipoprotein signal peptidase